MIKSMTVVNPKGEQLILELSNPDSSGLAIEKITGLGPSMANINTFEVATMDGGIYSSSRMTERDITIDLIMMFSPTIEEARLKTYQYFPIKKKVKLIFETDFQKRWCEGYVEKNEPNIFSDRESTQISIVCPTPYFFAVGEENQVFSGVHALFEFPFSNESVTDDLLEFGDVMIETRTVFDYPGDIDTGIVINIQVMNVASNIILYNIDTNEQLKINTDMVSKITGENLHGGDTIIISTVKGNRYAKLLREGAYTNIISAIDKTSDWFQISGGKNTFDFTAETGTNELIITLSYDVIYGGI